MSVCLCQNECTLKRPVVTYCCRAAIDIELTSLCLVPQVVILYFEPSTFRCILLRWVRLLGFATVYGTVTLKLHRYAILDQSSLPQRDNIFGLATNCKPGHYSLMEIKQDDLHMYISHILVSFSPLDNS